MRKTLKKINGGIETTFHVLAGTKNEAAGKVLLSALNSSHQAVNEGALRALMTRRCPVGKREILSRWTSLSDRWKKVIAERPARMSAVIRHAILGMDEQMCNNGCEAVLYLQEYDLVPALTNAAEDETNPNANLAAQTLLNLAQSLYEELAAPRDYNNRRDPQRVREHVVTSLEGSLERFEKHKRVEIVEAFLMLAKRSNGRLRRILQEPLSKMYLPVVESLSQSRRSGVIRLVLSFLDDAESSSAAMKIVAHRNDEKYLRHLMKKIGPEPSAPIKTNLKRITSISWMSNSPETFDLLDDDGQIAAVQMAVNSGINRIERFDVLEYLIKKGNAGGRRAAIAELAEFKGTEANKLTLLALEDNEPEVQAIALTQIRKRGIPGALTTLIEMVESPHEVIRDAARESLSEFSFSRFLAAFDMLDDDVRQSTGQLVKKIDPLANDALKEEMKSSSRARRLRAISVAETIGSIEDLEESLILLLEDEDHMVRSAIAKVLGSCNTVKARRALCDVLMDRSVIVHEAAEQSLQKLANRPLPSGRILGESPAEIPGTEIEHLEGLSAEQGSTT